jgi:DMSO/TMAO reductase YedYZ molybdopterin-dependent catalytic subunit
MTRVINFSIWREKKRLLVMKQKILLITAFLIITTASALLCVFPPNTRAETNTNNTWLLSITGYVTNSSNFTIADLQAMPKTTVNAAIYCVDFPGRIVEQGNWEGVQLGYLLSQVGVSASAVKVAFYATDGYSTDLTMQAAQSSNVIVAYAKDGTSLGGLRLVVPGHWGYKWIANLNSIKLVNYDFLGRWESQGYSDDAIITTQHAFEPTPTPGYPVPTNTPSPANSPTTTPLPTATPTPTATIPPSPASTEAAQPQGSTSNSKVQTIALTVIIVVAVAAIGLLAIKARKTLAAK